VTEGKLVVEVAGEEYQLDSGDSCYFDSRRPHRYVNPGNRGRRIIISVTPPSYWSY